MKWAPRCATTRSPAPTFRGRTPRGPQQTDHYVLEECGADQGRGFLLHKPSGQTYGTNVGGREDTCSTATRPSASTGLR